MQVITVSNPGAGVPRLSQPTPGDHDAEGNQRVVGKVEGVHHFVEERPSGLREHDRRRAAEQRPVRGQQVGFEPVRGARRRRVDSERRFLEERRQEQRWIRVSQEPRSAAQPRTPGRVVRAGLLPRRAAGRQEQQGHDERSVPHEQERPLRHGLPEHDGDDGDVGRVDRDRPVDGVPRLESCCEH